MKKLQRIAIIGAGIAGLRLAQRLEPRFDVCVFEKSKGLGGRMSTRRASDHAFDHGAQYFTARGETFRRFLAPFITDGTVQQWNPRLEILGEAAGDATSWTTPRYVAVPGMNDLCKAMAGDLQIRKSLRVAQIMPQEKRWRLSSETGEDCGLFDWVISTAPSVQSAALLPEAFSGHDALRRAQMKGCYSLMLGFGDPAGLPWDAAKVHGSPLAWIARNDSKPGRSGQTSFLCQSSNAWAEAHIEDCQDAVRDKLCAAFAGATGLDPSKASYTSLHRWRFAKVDRPAGQPYLLDISAGLAAAGDWCGAGRIESAFDSATALADAMMHNETV